MTDSTRRLLFGKATSTQNLKIKIIANIQYNDTPLTLKQSHSLPKTKMNKMNLQSPKATNIQNLSKLKKASNDFNYDKAPHTMLQNIKKASAQQNQNMNLSSSSKLKSHSKSKPSTNMSTNLTTSKSKIQSNRVNDYINKKLNQQQQLQQSNSKVNEPNVNEDNDDVKDTSVIDELISNEYTVSQKEQELNDFYNKNLSYENALGIINSEDNIDNMLTKSKEIISNLFLYQNMFYDIMKDKIQTKSNIKELLLKYNEKYRSIFKKQNRLNEQTESNLIRNNIAVNIHHEESKHLNDLIPLKQNELNVYKELFNITNTPDKDNKPQNNIPNKTNNDSMKLLLKAFTNLSHDNILDKLASSPNCNENDITNIKHIMNKYSIPQDHNDVEQNDNNEMQSANENIQLEYVVNGNGNEIGFDMNDIKLNKYLMMFYSKRKFPKIKFVKTSKNNYEYGTQKVVVKVEGENDSEIIRVRYVGGYVLIDKFLELNANLEEGKVKTSNIKKGNISGNSSAVKQKKNVKKK